MRHHIEMLIALVLLTGCGTMTVKEGSDPVIVYAEVCAETALTTFDAFLEWEYKNQDLVKTKAPQVHATANEIRRSGPTWISELRTATKAYKENPDASHANAVKVAREVVEFAAQEVRAHMLEGQATVK